MIRWNYASRGLEAATYSFELILILRKRGELFRLLIAFPMSFHCYLICTTPLMLLPTYRHNFAKTRALHCCLYCSRCAPPPRRVAAASPHYHYYAAPTHCYIIPPCLQRLSRCKFNVIYRRNEQIPRHKVILMIDEVIWWYWGDFHIIWLTGASRITNARQTKFPGVEVLDKII